jgi:hypothetical protein
MTPKDLEKLIDNPDVSPEVWVRLGMRITEAERAIERQDAANAGFSPGMTRVPEMSRKAQEAYNKKVGFIPKDEMERAREWKSYIPPTAKKDGGEFIRTSGEFEIELEIYIAEDGTRSITGFKGRRIDEVS